MSIIWYSNKTNSAGRTIETKAHKRLKDALAQIDNSGYVERQEWTSDGWEVTSQLIHTVVNFVPSAGEALAIESRLTIPYPALNLGTKTQAGFNRLP